MARRPRPPDEVLTKNDLAELQRRLSMMSVTAVQDFYQSAHMVCRIGPGHFPSARAIQELVQPWKQMRKWRRLRVALTDLWLRTNVICISNLPVPR